MPTIAPLLFEAETYLVQRDFDRAAELYRLAHSIDGGRSILPLLGVARTAVAIGRLHDAAALVEKALTQEPRSVEGLTIRAVIEEGLGQFDNALGTLKHAVDVNPLYGLAHFNLGRLYAQKKVWDLAQAHLQRASELQDESVECLVLLGVSMARSGSPVSAAKVLARAVQLAPDHFDANVTLADVLVEASELELADRVLASAAERFPGVALIASKRAAVAMRRGDVFTAIDHARDAAELAPDDEEAHLLVAVLAMSKLDLEQALKAVRSALLANPKSWRAHYELGGIFEALKQREPAKREYRAAASLNVEAWNARNNLASLLLEEKTLKAAGEAKALLDDAKTHAGASVFLVEYNLALTMWMLGDRLGSFRHARSCVSSGPAGHMAVEAAKRLLVNN